MRKRKTLLIIGAGVEQVPGIELAKKMGLFVLAVDGSPLAPGFKLADDHAVVSTYDVKGAVAFAKAYTKGTRKIDGVMTLASDVPVTVAAVAAALRLPGIPLISAKRAVDKVLMKRIFRKHEVAIPPFSAVRTVGEIKNFAKRHGYPIVLKPVDSRGARGVQRLFQRDDFTAALAVAKKESPTKRAMVEKFIAGPQYSTESLVYDGRIVTTGLSLRNYELLDTYAPHIIENGGDLVPELSTRQRRDLDDLLLRAANSLGITRGTLKGDVVWPSEGLTIIETAARLSGGYFATDQVPLATGVELVRAAIDLALGRRPNWKALKPRFSRGVSQRFFFPRTAGVIRNIRGVARARRMSGIERFYLYANKGDVVKKTTDHPSRLGCVIACASTKEQATKAAEAAVAAVEFVIQ
jgi:biotin carboxylase